MWLDQSRTARGPSWAPGRAIVVESNGMPRKAALHARRPQGVGVGLHLGRAHERGDPAHEDGVPPLAGLLRSDGAHRVPFSHSGGISANTLSTDDAALLACEPRDPVDHGRRSG